MSFDVLKEKRRAALRSLVIAAFRDAIGDFGDLKNGVGFDSNALQLAGAFERRDPLAEVVEGQRIPLCDRRL
jgi:hypothetical protein